MAIGNRLRFEILKRDGFQCAYCGASGKNAKLQVDHIKPRAAGGSDDPSNLITACRKCNSGKSDVPLAKSQVPASPIERFIDGVLRDAAVAADLLLEQEQMKADAMIADLDWIELTFPMGVPEGFM